MSFNQPTAPGRLARPRAPHGILSATIAMLLTTPAVGAGGATGAAGATGTTGATDSLLASTGDAVPDATAGADLLPTVLVTAERLSLPKYDLNLVQLPQTAVVVTSTQMQEQNVTSLRDALRNVSGISIGAGEGSYQGDNFSIRGLAGRSDMYLDGMSDWGNYNRDPFDTEQVEVLKGPSSVEFGRGAAGGVVNVASKMPQLQGFTALGLQYGTDATRRATLDFDAPIDALPGTAVRLNAMVHKSDIAGRPGPFYSRWGVAPAISFGLGSATRVTLSYFLQHQNDLPDYGLPWINDRPAPVPRGAFYGFTDGGNFFDTDVQLGTVKIEQDLGEHVTLREQFRLSDYHREFRISQASPPDQFQNNGDADIPLSELSSVLVDRTQIDGVSTDRSIDQAFDVLAHFATGAVQHSIDFGTEFLRQSVDPRRIEPCWVGVAPTPLLDPSPDDPFTGTSAVPGQTCTNVDAHTDDASAYALDTLKLGERWTAIASARVDHVTAHYYEWSPPTILAFEPGPLILDWRANNTLPSFRAALVFQPAPNGSFYLATGTSIHPNVAQLAISSETPLVPPPDWSASPVSRIFGFELGTKWSLADNRLLLTSAIYSEQVRNAAGVDVDDPLNYVTGARERIRGVELGVTGHLSDAWQVWLSYTYQDGIVTAASDPTLIGQQVLNSPRNSASLWTTYDLSPRWQIGFGANEVSTRTAWEQPDPFNGLILEAPGYVIGSAMARLRIARGLGVQANLTNIANKYYYDGVHPGHVVPGPGRALYVGLDWER